MPQNNSLYRQVQELGAITTKAVKQLADELREMLVTTVILLFGLAGAVLNINHSVWGFIVWIPVNLSLAYLNRKKPPLAVLFIAYAISCIWGIVKWSR